MHHSSIEQLRACLDQAFEECDYEKKKKLQSFNYYMHIFHYMCSDEGKEGEQSLHNPTLLIS